MVRRPIEEVLNARLPELMALPGVLGGGIGETDGVPCVTVFVVERTPALEAAIPATLDGHPVILEESGEFGALGY